MSALIKERPSADAVLAKAVLAAREQLGLTQLELAGIVGVDRSAISRWKTQGLRALMGQVQGLVHVLEYLDAIRGKV